MKNFPHCICCFVCLLCIVFAQTAYAQYASLPDTTMDRCILEEDAYVLFDSVMQVVSDKGAFRADHVLKVRVLNDQGANHGIHIAGENSLFRLKNIEIIVTDTAGTELKKLNKGDGLRQCGFGSFEVFSDICQYMFRCFPGQYPYDFIVTSRHEAKTLFFLSHFVPIRQIPTRRSVYVLTTPSDLDISVVKWKIAPDSIITVDSKQTTRVYHAENLAYPYHDDCAHITREYIPAVFCTPTIYTMGKNVIDGTSWSTLSRSGYTMMQECFRIDSKLQHVVDSIHTLQTTCAQFCDNLHDYLDAKTRYVAIEIGLGGWIPTPSVETFERGYGDCKDLSTLYATMLQSAGYDVKTVLIDAGSSSRVLPDIPAMNIFNHAILFAASDGDTIWMDPTCYFCRPGDLPASDENRYVLVLDSSGSGLVRTPVSTPEENCIARTAHLNIEGQRSVSGNLTFRLYGNSRHRVLGILTSDYDISREVLFQSDFYGLGKHFTVTESSHQDYPDTDPPYLEVNFTGAMNNVIHKVGERRYCSIDFFSSQSFCESQALSNPDAGISFDFPHRYLDSILIVTPPQWQLAVSDTSWYEHWGGVTVSAAQIGDTTAFIRLRDISQYDVAPEQMPNFVAHLAQVRELLPRRISYQVIP